MMMKSDLTQRILKAVDGEQKMDIILACTTALAYVIQKLPKEQQEKAKENFQILFDRLVNLP